MNRFLSSFKDKRFRYGSFSTAMILIVIAVFVFVNLVAGQFNVTKDLTEDKMFSLSSYSREFVQSLDQDVTIYALFRTGQEDMMFKQLLDEYDSLSDRITVEYRDPSLYPTFVAQFSKPDESIEDNSVIIECGSKFKVIQYSEMVTYEFNYSTYNYELVSYDYEPQISRAINYVIMGEMPVVYFVTGNNEYPLPANLIKQIEMANYEFREIDLVMNEIPEDCDMLFITTPGRDWSTDQAERIQNFLAYDGRAVFALGYTSQRFSNMDNVLAAYGVQVGDYFVLEGDTNYFYMNTPTMLIPQLVSHEVTQTQIDKKYFPLLFQSSAIETLSLKKTSTVVEPLLISSNKSYGKNNPDSETVNKEPGDPEGPFNLAVAITDSYYTDTQHTTKMVVFGCDYMLEESINNAIGGTNWELLVSSVNWLQEQSNSLYIPSKSPSSISRLTYTQAQAGLMVFISVVALPLLCMGTGLVVWVRRRHN